MRDILRKIEEKMIEMRKKEAELREFCRLSPKAEAWFEGFCDGYWKALYDIKEMIEE